MGAPKRKKAPIWNPALQRFQSHSKQSAHGISIQSSGCVGDAAIEIPVELEVEFIDETSNITTEKRVVSADNVARSQGIIAGALNADKAEQDQAINEAVQLLYPYPPRDGQRDALRQLIYQKKDLIL